MYTIRTYENNRVISGYGIIHDGVVQIAYSNSVSFDAHAVEKLTDLANYAESLRAENERLKAQIAEMEPTFNAAVAEYSKFTSDDVLLLVPSARYTCRAVHDYLDKQKPAPDPDLAPLRELLAQMKATLDRYEAAAKNLPEAK